MAQKSIGSSAKKIYTREDVAGLTDAKNKIDPLLYNLLIHATPFGSEHTLLRYMPKGYYKDKFGNIIYRIGNKKDHRIMFSCHMDTVHRQPDKLKLLIGDSYVFATDLEEAPSILGADDKLGMYIMIKMMEKKIPGIYVFHLGEECGGKGSSFIQKETPELVAGLDYCVAFDRKDYTNIITHQRSLRCCSENFAVALAKELNNKDSFPPYITWKPDPTGSFTDSANYTSLIPECTNLSVGYFNQHTTSEHFDWFYLEQLLIPAVLKVNWQNLPVERDVKVTERRSYGNSAYGTTYNKKSTPTTLSKVKVNETGTRIGNAVMIKPCHTTATTEWNKIKVQAFKGIPQDCSKEAFKAVMMKKLVWEGASKFLEELYDHLKDIEKQTDQLKEDAEKIIDNERAKRAKLAEEQETLENIIAVYEMFTDLDRDIIDDDE